MGNYSEADKKAFREKDERISKLAIVKSLIEKCNLEDVYAVNPITELANRYMQYVNGVSDSNVASDFKEINWNRIAADLNLALPTQQNIKILDSLMDEYKNITKASAEPSDILMFIIDNFGAYPTNQNSVKVVLKKLLGEN